MTTTLRERVNLLMETLEDMTEAEFKGLIHDWQTQEEAPWYILNEDVCNPEHECDVCIGTRQVSPCPSCGSTICVSNDGVQWCPEVIGPKDTRSLREKIEAAVPKAPLHMEPLGERLSSKTETPGRSPSGCSYCHGYGCTLQCYESYRL